MILSFRKIERRMAERGFTNKELANAMDVTQAAVSKQFLRIQAGEEVKPATVANLARGLACTIDDILAAPLPRSRRQHTQGKAA